MDPLTGLGLAANILQFIDFTTKIISGSVNLYQSDSGTKAEHFEVESFARHLRELADKMILPETSGHGVFKDEGKALKIIATQCREIADELLDVLQDLKVKEPHARWQSFYQALRSEWKQNTIEKLQQRLSRLGDLIVQRMNAEFQEKVLTKFYELAADNNRLESNRAADIESLRVDFQWLIKEVKKADKSDETTASGDLSLRKATYISNSVNMGVTAGKGLEYHAEQLVLDHLQFAMMNARQAAIPEAHTKTFSWIFEPQALDDKRPSVHNFTKWLASDDPFFWVSGKPGSGKSTLMKFIVQHEQSTSALKAWAGNHELVIASFFFWNPGRSTLQKSQEGLLRSILYQILRRSPALLKLVLPSLWQDAVSEVSIRNGPRLETIDDLLAAFKKTTEYLKESKTRFCFFIDGLDEYEGNPADIVRLIRIFLQTAHVKLCVASRPWNEFEKEFGQVSERKLYMQDLTRSDIEIYVKDTLEKDCSFQELQHEDGRYADLVQEIAETASGVFLWVVLVVRSLLEGITNGDRVSDLQRRLRLLPTELDDFFERILFTVNEFYMEETAYAFQVTITSGKVLPLMTYWFIDEEDTSPAVDLEIKPMTITEYMKCQAQITKRLNARCKGLLEIVAGEHTTNTQWTVSSDIFYFSVVDFLHRTLRDYLRIPKTQNLLSHWSAAKPDPRVAICKGILAQLKTAPDEMKFFHKTFEDVVQTFFYHAISLEGRDFPPSLEIRIIDQIENAFTQLAAFNSDSHGNSKFQSSKTILERAACYGLERYVAAKMPQLSDHDLDDLLAHVVVPFPELHGSDQYRQLAIVKLVMEKARSIEQAWDCLLTHLSPTHSGERQIYLNLPGVAYKVVRAFLEHGADPHYVWHSKNDLYDASSHNGQYGYDAATIIGTFLTAEEVGALGDLLPKGPLESLSTTDSATGNVNYFSEQAQLALHPSANPHKRKLNFLKNLFKR